MDLLSPRRKRPSGGGIEQMRLRQVESRVDRFATTEHSRVEHAPHPFATGKIEEHQRFVAERFGDGDREIALECSAAGAGMNPVAGREEIVRPQASVVIR
jgi:hypothetical protein